VQAALLVRDCRAYACCRRWTWSIWAAVASPGSSGGFSKSTASLLLHRIYVRVLLPPCAVSGAVSGAVPDSWAAPGITCGPRKPLPLLLPPAAAACRILDFSIAYGKTAHGLSKDWGVSLEEAEATVNRWYADRPEVRQWQADTKTYAFHHGHVNTMIGRRRGLLPAITSSDKWLKARAERAAINTPIQGSAADVASASDVVHHHG